VTDFDHGLGFDDAFLANARPETAGKNHSLHGRDMVSASPLPRSHPGE
jgi:hypothetical protein